MPLHGPRHRQQQQWRMVERRDPRHSNSHDSFKIATAFRRGTADASTPGPAPAPALSAATAIATIHLDRLLCCRPVVGLIRDLYGVMGEGKRVSMQRLQQQEERSSQNMTVSALRVRVPSLLPFFYTKPLALRQCSTTAVVYSST